MRNRLEFADNLVALPAIPSGSVPLIYIDPPFNTGKRQRRTTMKATRSENGGRLGFAGQLYDTTILDSLAYADTFDDYLGFLGPRLAEAHRILAPNGSLYVHLDAREVHYVKILLDHIFGRSSFLNEIIWVYDYGGRARNRWPAKHDNILVYVKNPRDYVFNAEDVEREPYMAPGLVTPEKVARGKLPTDCWWHTIVSPTGREKTGYPTQKPIGVLKRIVAASSNPGDLVLDFFAGSGTTGAAAHALNRRFHLIDNNPDALETMRKRFAAIVELDLIGLENLPPQSEPEEIPIAGV
jgi:site-specific DNA-methyltransferase (adenine-specific)